MDKNYVVETLTSFISRYDNENTQNSYLTDLKGFIKFISSKQLKNFKIDYQIASEYREFLKTKDYSTPTFARKLIVVKKFYSFLRGLGKVSTNPFEAVRIPTVDRESKTKNIDDESIKKIIKLASENVKHKLIVYFLVFHGMRESEIARIKIDNLRLDEETPYIIIEGKRDKSRIHPIRPDMVEVIKDFINKNEEYLFSGQETEHIHRQSIWRIVKKLGNIAGVDVHPHQFRHYAITKARDSGMTIEQVKEFAGHVDINTTNRYYRTKQNLEDSPVLKISESLNIENKENK